MPLQERVSQEELILYEICRNPVLLTEFIENFDKRPEDEPFELHSYQREILADFNSYISVVSGRSTGKTVSVVSIIRWMLIYNVFPDDYLVYLVPSKVHLEPVWSGLIRTFRTNTFLKQFIAPNSGINSSDFKISLLNRAVLMARIAGQTGTGVSVVGLHTPMFFVDECITGKTKIASLHSNKIISRIKPGDKIISWNGSYSEEDTVISIDKTERNQKILEIGYNNKYIRVGENHLIFNGIEYIKASDLKTGDSLFLYDNIERKYFTEIEKDIIYDCVKNGENTTQIANKLNRSQLSIQKYLNRNYGNVKTLRDSFELTEEQKQIIIGSLLGDGSAEFVIERARYRTNHSLKQKEYVDWIADKLSNIIRTKPRIAVNGGWGTYNYCLGTIGHKTILEIAKSLYINGKKTITREYLDKLTPLGLAVWFMDDGSESGMFSTHSFSKEENEIIVNYLIEKWNIESKVLYDKRHNLYFVGIKHKSLSRLKEIILEYLPKSMLYKVGEGTYNNTLPEIILISKSEEVDTLIETKITYIKEVNTRSKYIYNIEVEKNHNYFANGVLVKNSSYQPWGSWIELQPTINTFTQGFRLMITGVPDGRREKSVCWACDQENSNYSKFRISADRNPLLNTTDRQKAIEQYGGEDSDEFIHLWLGQHGKPVFALFDRSLLLINSYPVWKLSLDGVVMGDNIADYVTRISAFPGLSNKSYKCFMGIDLGYSPEPTAIWIFYTDDFGRIKFHGKLRMSRVSFPIQERLIDLLDTKFEPTIIGIDKGSGGQGISLIQHLVDDKEYIHKNFAKRISPIDFNSNISLGFDSNGEELKSLTKPFAITMLQDYCNNHKIVFSSTDLEMITELERMTYTKNPTGAVVYRTLTPKGGKKGEDHFTAALLCGTLAYYMANDFFLSRPEKKKLFNPVWIMN